MPKTFEVRITKRGKDPRQWIREVQTRIYPELQNEIVLSAEATAVIMRKILEGSGYRLQALAGAIGVDVLSSTGGVHVGIGNIDTFPKGKNGQTYWEAFNDGFKPGAANAFLPLGAFPDGAPDSSKSGGKWLVGAGNYTFFDKNTNKKPIPPLRFVDIAYSDLVAHIEKTIDKFTKELEKASK
jgi:hypothetical protein